MGISGPAPKEEPVRRNKPTHEEKNLDRMVRTESPDLPEGITWHQRTLEWYQGWRNSPQSQVFVLSDWEALLETAVLHTRFWTAVFEGGLKPTEFTNLSAELRRRMAQFGATYEDRLKLRMKIEAPKSAETEEEEIQTAAKQAIDYMSRLTQAAADLKEE